MHLMVRAGDSGTQEFGSSVTYVVRYTRHLRYTRYAHHIPFIHPVNIILSASKA